ncbi:MAG: hypothetical protein HY079_09755, partial [Elusimicrobia bacterium]|nr:hypothetical protein [Elusimicrobiota bacterium]
MTVERERGPSFGAAESAAFAVLMAAAAYLERQNPLFVYPDVLWASLGLLVFNLVNFAALSARLEPRARALVAVAVNAALIGLVVRFSGGRGSYFWVLFLLPIFTSALALGRTGARLTLGAVALLLASFYAPALRARIWPEVLELATKALTLAAAAEMIRRVASSERRARAHLRQKHSRALRERRETRESLQSMDRLATLGALSAGIAHDLNGPLASILGHAEVALENGPDDLTGKALERILFSAKHCRDVVRNTLAFARRQTAEREVVALNALVRRCADLKRHDWIDGAVRLEEDYAAAEPRALVCGPEIQQVVFNLLTNADQALRSANGGGRIVARTVAVDGRARVEIEDDGPGIPPAVLARVWEPFFTTKPAGQGTGLGLSI